MRGVLLVTLLFFTQAVLAQQWESIGPDGGFFKDFLVHPEDDNIIYAGSDDGGGIWKSIDHGQNWSLLTANFINCTAWDIEMDPNDHDVIYATDLYGRWGVLKSINGQDFTQITNGLTFERDLQASDISIDPNDSSVLMLATGEENDGAIIGNGVFKSTNSGESWQRTSLQGEAVPSCVIGNSGLWLAGTSENGLLVSPDEGESWTSHEDLPTNTTIYSMDQRGDAVLVSAGILGVYLSVDAGESFESIGMIGQFNFDVHLISALPIRAVSTGFDAPYLYNGVEWISIDSDLVQDQLMIGAGGEGDELYMGLFSSTQILHSSDGGLTWERLQNNPNATEISAVLEKDGVLYASLQNSYSFSGDANNTSALAISTNGGLNWERISLQAHGLDLESGFGLNEVYLGTFAQGLFKSDDLFQTFQNVREGNKLIGDFEVSAYDSEHILAPEVDWASFNANIITTENAGSDWNEMMLGIVNDIEQIDELTYIAAIENNGVFVSFDGGQTWSAEPFALAGINVLELAVQNDQILAGTDQSQLWRIENLTTTALINGPWEEGLLNEVKNILQNEEIIVVGLNNAEQDSTYSASGGVFLSSDSGQNWTELSNGLYNNNVFGMKGLSFDSNGDLLAATYGGGVFKYPLSDNSIDHMVNEPRWIITRDQNQLHVDFGKTLVGEIKIVDSSGRTIESYSVQNKTFSCSPNLSQGLYFIQYWGGNSLFTQKVFW